MAYPSRVCAIVCVREEVGWRGRERERGRGVKGGLHQ